jgi:NAD(P)-dependent dehydrogenase (short-subunit alcohol dehydrogenase family)/ketosteroid isomerase-like protein
MVADRAARWHQCCVQASKKEAPMDRVWFVTGASSGFGRALSLAALQNGDRVVATARNTDDLRGIVEPHAGRAFALPLDVTDPDAAREAVAQAVGRFGRIDAVFNNAGYGHVGAVEELSDQDLRRQLDVNLLGVINVTRAALPVLRRQGAGHFVQMASLNGVEPLPGGAYYTASKFAVKGFSEALAAEVAPLGIRVTIVEPGPFRTRFMGAAKWAKAMPEYAESVGKTRETLRNMDGKQPGDPARAAQAILHAVQAARPPLHLPLGRMAFENIRNTLGAQLEELKATANIGADTDFPDPVEVVRRAYHAFNEHDVEAGVALMDAEVDWPDMSKDGSIHGQAGVREHWRDQFRQADPRIEVRDIAERDHGVVEAQVRQIVRAPDGRKLADQRLVHVFTFAGGRIKRLDVRT